MKKLIMNYHNVHTKVACKILLIISLLFFCYESNAQNNGIKLICKSTNDSIFYKENTRIKIKTTDGTSYTGKYSIVDDKTILIKDLKVPLDSIVKLKKRTVFSSIVRPISLTLGAALATAAYAGIAAGGYGFLITAVALPPSLPLVIVPLTTNNHKQEKWNYTISSIQNDVKEIKTDVDKKIE